MVVIESLLPNPTGNDRDGEWITVTNTGLDSIDIRGWQLRDEGGAICSLSTIGSVAGGEAVKLERSFTGITFNNDGDTIFLYDANGELVDQLGYTGQIIEGEMVQAGFAAEVGVPGDTSLGIGLGASALGGGSLNYKVGVAPILVGLALSLAAAVLFIFIYRHVQDIVDSD